MLTAGATEFGKICGIQIGIYRSFAPFLFRQERCPKEADIGEALRANAPSPMYLTRRIAIQHSKMFRFLNACILQIYRLALQSPLKIGTFSVGGDLRGGSGVRGECCSAQRIRIVRLPVASAPLFLLLARNASPRTTSLVTFLFGHKKVTSCIGSINSNLNNKSHEMIHKKIAFSKILCYILKLENK